MGWHDLKEPFILLKKFSVPKSMWYVIDYGKREYKVLYLETHQSEEAICVSIVQQKDNVTRGILWTKLRTAEKKYCPWNKTDSKIANLSEYGEQLICPVEWCPNS